MPDLGASKRSRPRCCCRSAVANHLPASRSIMTLEGVNLRWHCLRESGERASVQHWLCAVREYSAGITWRWM